MIAQTLCECDGKDWLVIEPAARDRYVRIAILIDHRIVEAGLQSPGAPSGRSGEDLPDPPITPAPPSSSDLA